MRPKHGFAACYRAYNYLEKLIPVMSNLLMFGSEDSMVMDMLSRVDRLMAHLVEQLVPIAENKVDLETLFADSPHTMELVRLFNDSDTGMVGMTVLMNTVVLRNHKVINNNQ